MLPKPLFSKSYSTIVETENGTLVGARIAEDQQWRFPTPNSIPVKFKHAIINFEDRYFYVHPGVNPIAILRALKDNIISGKIVSGGSTLTMQLARLARTNQPRNIWQKLIELFWAIRIEMRYSKDDILKLYSTHAPFGGNVVGLEAASWRYYRCSPDKLSWAESAALAVLPNAPSEIFPGKKDSKLLSKRNRLLRVLYDNAIIDKTSYELAILEPVPQAAFRLPNGALHLVDRFKKSSKGMRVVTTINPTIQEKGRAILNQHQAVLRYNKIENMAAVIAEVNSGKVLAYIGNTGNRKSGLASYVDICQSPRSSGSVLKPLLYALSIDNGKLLPQELLPDVPTNFGGFSPLNFNLSYEGAVNADEAIARSLNIPAVHLLHRYGVAPFYNFLGKVGFSTLYRAPENYGLSLILGGAEVTLFDLCSAYASMGRVLNHFNTADGSYYKSDIRSLQLEEGKVQAESEIAQPLINAWPLFKMFEAMKKVTRPDSEMGWESFASANQIAWKTGTSFGFRDAWAVGVTSDYIVGVWAGNATGEGRPGLIGSRVAAPALFDLFRILPNSEADFKNPVSEETQLEICVKSGCVKSPDCPAVTTLSVSADLNISTRQCSYHVVQHLNKEGKYRVNSECYPVYEMTHKTYFILPPLWAYFYEKKHPDYDVLPPILRGCSASSKGMQMIYPRESSNLFIPVQLDGYKKGVVFKVAYQEEDGIIYWHLDEEYLGSTEALHEMILHPTKGEHTLKLVNSRGEELVKKFVLYGE